MVGLNSGLIHYGLLAILSATIVAMLSSIGIILAVAFLIAPGAIAFLLVRRFAAMLAVSVAVAVLAGLCGVYASFWIDSAPAPTIVLLLTAIFAVALTFRNVTDARRAG
jgi:manganese/iron transport system permease protein